MFENFLQPHILQPTRFINKQTPSLIDNIYSNNLENNCISGNITSKISDHLPNFIISDNINYKFESKIKKTERNFTNFSEKKFLQSLSNNLSLNFNYTMGNTNNNFESFHDCFIQSLNDHAPYRTITRKESKLKLIPWLTNGILKSIQVKNSIYKNFIRTKDPFIYTRYKHYRDKLTKLIRLSKKNYYKSNFLKVKHNSKKVWIGIKKIINKQKQSCNQGIMLYENKVSTTDQKSVSNKFFNFFTNIVADLVKKLPTSTKLYSDYLQQSQPNSFYLGDTSEFEISNILKDLDSSKSCDIYGISAKILKISSPVISPFLCKLFNGSFAEGIFPSKLKYAKVIPIHKGGSKLSVNNYRPISILPIISKILEKLMHNRLTSFLEKNNTIFEHQYGFQKGKSTSLAIMDLQYKLLNSLDHKKTSVDFAKAFDTVNHKILIEKLKYMALEGSNYPGLNLT